MSQHVSGPPVVPWEGNVSCEISYIPDALNKYLHKEIPHELSSKSMSVVAAHVSVRPYPCKTGQQRVIFINLCVSGAKGAPPDKTNLMRPPRNARIGLNRVLKMENNENILIVHWKYLCSKPTH